MERPPRRRAESIITRACSCGPGASWAIVSAVLVTSGLLATLLRRGWSLGDDVAPGTALHETYLRATTMTFAGIVACQIGTALAARTDRVSLLRIGFFSNRLLLGGIAFELLVAAAAIYLPAAQHVFDTRPLTLPQLALLTTFPPIVWGADELFPVAPAQVTDSVTKVLRSGYPGWSLGR